MENEEKIAKNFLLDNTCKICTGWPHCMRGKNREDTCENFKLNPNSEYLNRHKTLIDNIKRASDMIYKNTKRGAPSVIVIDSLSGMKDD